MKLKKLIAENKKLKSELSGMHQKYDMAVGELSVASGAIDQLKSKVKEYDSIIHEL